MKKILVQSWTKDIKCLCAQGGTTRIYKAVSDFYEGFDFFICPCCQELFALNLETFKYLNKSMADILKQKICPYCATSAEKFLSYPKNYVCSVCKDLQKIDDIEISQIRGPVEMATFYDLLS